MHGLHSCYVVVYDHASHSIDIRVDLDAVLAWLDAAILTVKGAR